MTFTNTIGTVRVAVLAAFNAKPPVIGGWMRDTGDDASGALAAIQIARDRVPVAEAGSTQAAQDDSSGRVGVLLINLGTPEKPTPAAVRRYLAQFLSDARVVEIPRVLWLPILHGVVLRTRSIRIPAYSGIRPPGCAGCS